MTRLERDLGVTLFGRHRDGFDLTDDGMALLELAGAMEQGVLAIERWRAQVDPQPEVRIAAGPWTSLFAARHVTAFAQRDGAPSIAFVTGAATTDLLRREAHIGLRNRRPEASGLAGRRLARVAFAIYGAGKSAATEHHIAPDLASLLERADWISLAASRTPVPSTIWLEQRLTRAPRVQCSTPDALLAAARAGAGLCVLPCFIGDADAALVRMSNPIRELTHDQWLVVHNDDRHMKPVRQAADWLADLIRTHRSLFAGSV